MRLTKANARTNTLWSDFPLFLTATTTLLVILSLSCLPTTWAALSDKRLCADEKCERIISMGTAKISYRAGEEGMLPFKIHSPVRIMSKSAGSNPKLWGVEINGRRGYANKDFILENKIFIKESDLTYELPLQSAVNQEADAAAAPTEAAAAAPTEAAEAPTEAAPAQGLENPLQQPVLNASETADTDAAAATVTATTTSPLDTLNLAILTEQDQQATSGEASTPITPVQPNLQLIDGTQLPLEAVPATTERDSNLTKDDNKPKANIAELVTTTTTTTSNEEFEENEDGDDEEGDDDDDGGVYDEVDDDEEASSLDSKDNEYRKTNGTEADNAAQPLEIKAAPEEVLVTKSETASSSQETPPSTGDQFEQQLNSSNAIQEEAVANVTELPGTVPVEPAQPLASENQVKLEAETTQEEDKAEEVKTIDAEKTKEDTLKATEDQEVKLTEAEKEKVEKVVLAQEEGLVAQQVQAENATEAQPAIEQADKAQIYQPVEPLSIQTHLTEASHQTIEAPILSQEIEPKVLDVESKVPSIASPVDAQSQLNALPKETEQTAAQAQLQVEKVEVHKENETLNGTQSSEDQLVVDEAITDSVAAVPEVTAAPPVEQVPTASLPPLFNKKSNFNDPNEIYKEMQKERERQELAKKLELEAQQVELRQKEEQQKREQEQALQKEAQEKKALEEAQQKEAQEKKALEEAQQKEAQEMEAQQKEAALKEAQEKEAQLKKAQEKEAQEKKAQEKAAQEKAAQEKEEQEKKEAKLREAREKEAQLKEAQQKKAQEEAQQKLAQSQEQLPVTTPNTPNFDAYDAAYDAEATPAPVPLATGTVEPVRSPLSTPPEIQHNDDAGLGLGLFSTIMSTVNSFISNEGVKEPETVSLTSEDELHRLLYPHKGAAAEVPGATQAAEGHCLRPMDGTACHASINLDNFPEIFAAKVLDNSLLLLCVLIAAASSLFFVLVYYCFCNSSQEGALLSKLNHLERSLLAAHKENLILKHDLMTTRTKLSSIEDNSFGSNDMVAALKKELETELYEKAKLQEQVSSLEKDLDNAAEAGLELNKMLSEVLNSQNGDEAFMSTVEELQRQLNDQDKVINEINANLAEKSRENSELQYSYTESTTRLTSEMKSLQQDNYELEMEKAKLQTRIEEMQAETEQELAKALEARNYEMQRLQHQIMEASAKFDKEHNELQTSLSKIEALEECLRQLKKDGGNANVQELIVSAKTRGELKAAQKKYLALQTKLEQELAAKARLEQQLQISSGDVEQLKQDYNQSESDKLEAQTRLEVLSGYFREKETQLQKELSLQEAKWLQHQGENASTVETQTLMKNEIQTLKSQNDELRAEIEAQIASHKAQMGTLENRAHESWLAARQSERRCEEALAEAAALRRKLTTMASGGGGLTGGIGELSLEALPTNGDLNSNPSPLPLPLPGSPGLLNMPNALPFLPAPFSPFMGLPPPFLPPPPGAAAAGGVGGGGGARLPPLGRMRSPPPTSSSRGGDRYSPQRDDRDDYSDYDDYDEEEEDERLMDRPRQRSGSWSRGRRDDYMHSPRTYRSLSPSDSRYNYNNDTETDYSPPPSPPPPRKNSSRPISEV